MRCPSNKFCFHPLIMLVLCSCSFSHGATLFSHTYPFTLTDLTQLLSFLTHSFSPSHSHNPSPPSPILKGANPTVPPPVSLPPLPHQRHNGRDWRNAGTLRRPGLAVGVSGKALGNGGLRKGEHLAWGEGDAQGHLHIPMPLSWLWHRGQFFFSL